jgi:hypothetical protein
LVIRTGLTEEDIWACRAFAGDREMPVVVAYVSLEEPPNRNVVVFELAEQLVAHYHIGASAIGQAADNAKTSPAETLMHQARNDTRLLT